MPPAGAAPALSQRAQIAARAGSAGRLSARSTDRPARTAIAVGARAGLAPMAEFVAVALDLARELVATSFSEWSISGEASRARSVTPFRYSVASATWRSAIEGLRSL